MQLFHKFSVFRASREKEDLQQQSSEIRQKLQGKVNECLSLEKSKDETAKKLNETQLLIQQVSPSIESIEKNSENTEYVEYKNSECSFSFPGSTA